MRSFKESKDVFAQTLRVKLGILLLLLAAAPPTFAHQQPTTIVNFDISADKVRMELELPIPELELAMGKSLSGAAESIISDFGPDISSYLLEHIDLLSDGKLWKASVAGLRIAGSEQQSGQFREIVADITLTPPAGVDPRRFRLGYDVIMHQVVTHIAFVSIRSDWESGVIGGHPSEIGVIRVDTATSKIAPLDIDLTKGSTWNGFKRMVRLGMDHIGEGVDHLLFLLVLLLPAPLVAKGKKWAEYGGAKYGISRLLRIVTAFTIGHSATLVLGSLGLFALPQQPVEILIAFSVLISAIHAFRPIFPGREPLVAAGFGLVHGMAFAATLAELNLSASQMALSLLGFNLGIELMQLVVIALVVPWLLLLSKSRYYAPLRFIGASFASVAAIAWIVERVSGTSNAVASGIQDASEYGFLAVMLLATIAVASWTIAERRQEFE